MSKLGSGAILKDESCKPNWKPNSFYLCYSSLLGKPDGKLFDLEPGNDLSILRLAASMLQPKSPKPCTFSLGTLKHCNTARYWVVQGWVIDQHCKAFLSCESFNLPCWIRGPRLRFRVFGAFGFRVLRALLLGQLPIRGADSHLSLTEPLSARHTDYNLLPSLSHVKSSRPRRCWMD